MSEPTHTYEIEINGLSWEGEITFNGTADVKYSIDNNVHEISVDEHMTILKMFRAMSDVFCKCGTITKIEITKKA